MTFLRRFTADKDGATAIEYGIGADLSGLFNAIAGQVAAATPSS
jgi:Flp pilus assembly pilin Flp